MSAVLSPRGLPLSTPLKPGYGAQRSAAPTPAPTPLASRPARIEPPGNGSRGTGLVAVVGLHLLLLWGLASGLARDAIEIIKKPIETAILTEAPPPPPPPKVVKIEPPKTRLPPPPAYVPPPEIVATVTPPQPVIQAVQAEPPKQPPVIAAAPAPAPEAVPAPPPAPTVVRREISLACPGYETILAQALEEASERVGLRGTVQTLIKIRGNQVVEVTPQSGPKEYYKYVQAAVKRMRCTAGGADEVQVSLPVIFS